ncbi:hypothetical protein [Campylobacter sp. 19-13652]|uniref:hypothetical protein n=1 Tax=Campylobacter sp. 19-13652 TaxID=2840180 RepID=UPI001C793DB3|nr:hypothetical protein [Campylobacter sp. 19-13652]BCX78927.1 hypothetical protein LBC_03890 [Campylobacter sp. 19-13652]
MMKFTSLSKFIAGILASLALVGCSYKTSVDSNAGDFAYLKFITKSTLDVSVDGAESFKASGGNYRLYKIKSGKSHVKAYANGELVIDKDIYVGANSTYTFDVR